MPDFPTEPAGSTAPEAGTPPIFTGGASPPSPSGVGRGEASPEAPLRTYRVRDKGVRCITFPCLQFEVSSEEGGVEQVHEVDLSALGLDGARQEELQKALYGRGLTVRGRILTRPDAGPAGDARVLVVEALEK